MNTTVMTRPGRIEEQHPPWPGHHAPTRRRRVGVIDQIALHVGLALVVWSRRPRVIDHQERRANRAEQHLARVARERQAERSLRLMAPPR